MRRTDKDLLKDRNVNRWYQNYARSAITTADERLRRPGRTCSELKHTPQSFLDFKTTGPLGFDDFVKDCVDAALSKSQHPSNVRNNLLVIKSWPGFNGLRIHKTVKLPVADYELERIATRDVVRIQLTQLQVPAGQSCGRSNRILRPKT